MVIAGTTPRGRTPRSLSYPFMRVAHLSLTNIGLVPYMPRRRSISLPRCGWAAAAVQRLPGQRETGDRWVASAGDVDRGGVDRASSARRRQADVIAIPRGLNDNESPCKERGSRASVRGGELAFARFQIERQAIHAPALPAGIAWPIIKEVAEMGVAAGATNLGPVHAVRAIFD